MTLQEINKEDKSASFRSVCFAKPQIFVEIFCTNFQSPPWRTDGAVMSCYVVAHQHGGRKIAQTSETYFSYLGN